MYRCFNCGKFLGKNRGFEVYENERPTGVYFCDFQCLTLWDCSGPGFKGNQAFNLANVDLRRIRNEETTHKI
ncbi:MAG: hypothetical protein QXY45_01690 [Candidatus Aenigmatarchaeota archaeon]